MFTNIRTDTMVSSYQVFTFYNAINWKNLSGVAILVAESQKDIKHRYNLFANAYIRFPPKLWKFIAKMLTAKVFFIYGTSHWTDNLSRFRYCFVILRGVKQIYSTSNWSSFRPWSEDTVFISHQFLLINCFDST